MQRNARTHALRAALALRIFNNAAAAAAAFSAWQLRNRRLPRTQFAAAALGDGGESAAKMAAKI